MRDHSSHLMAESLIHALMTQKTREKKQFELTSKFSISQKPQLQWEGCLGTAGLAVSYTKLLTYHQHVMSVCRYVVREWDADFYMQSLV